MRAVTIALNAIRKHKPNFEVIDANRRNKLSEIDKVIIEGELIDRAILSAINLAGRLATNFDNGSADRYNRDIAMNGRKSA